MASEKPTAAELEILAVLWDRGPATVREVHEILARTNDVGYTTILKQMQVMHQKGLVERDTSQRAHTYVPAVPREEIQRSAVHDLVEKLFGGSARQLVVHALSGEKLSPSEIDELQQLLDSLEREEE